MNVLQTRVGTLFSSSSQVPPSRIIFWGRQTCVQRVTQIGLAFSSYASDKLRFVRRNNRVFDAVRHFTDTQHSFKHIFFTVNESTQGQN